MLEITFPGLIGQTRIVNQIKSEAKSGRLSHAYLMVGPKGSGRALIATLLFAALNCANRQQQPAPCERCPSCQRALKRQHENLLVVEPPHEQRSAQIKIEQLRDIMREINFPPLNNGARLILIREAEHMNPTSANALLKVLEEPPPGNLFILTVQETEELLPTIVSRCRRLNIDPLPVELIINSLVERGYDLEDAQVRASLSGGSIGQALQIDPALYIQTLLQLIEHIKQKKDFSADLDLSNEIISQFKAEDRIDRLGLTSMLDLLGQYYRDLAVNKANRPQFAILPTGQLTLLLDDCINKFNLVRKTQNDILANVQPELALALLLDSLRQ